MPLLPQTQDQSPDLTALGPAALAMMLVKKIGRPAEIVDRLLANTKPNREFPTQAAAQNEIGRTQIPDTLMRLATESPRTLEHVDSFSLSDHDPGRISGANAMPRMDPNTHLFLPPTAEGRFSDLAMNSALRYAPQDTLYPILRHELTHTGDQIKFLDALKGLPWQDNTLGRLSAPMAEKLVTDIMEQRFGMPRSGWKPDTLATLQSGLGYHGGSRAFLPTLIYALLSKEVGYHDNPFERSARTAEFKSDLLGQDVTDPQNPLSMFVGGRGGERAQALKYGRGMANMPVDIAPTRTFDNFAMGGIEGMIDELGAFKVPQPVDQSLDDFLEYLVRLNVPADRLDVGHGGWIDAPAWENLLTQGRAALTAAGKSLRDIRPRL